MKELKLILIYDTQVTDKGVQGFEKARKANRAVGNGNSAGRSLPGASPSPTRTPATP
jgi:hypothetical protein